MYVRGFGSKRCVNANIKVLQRKGRRNMGRPEKSEKGATVGRKGNGKIRTTFGFLKREYGEILYQNVVG